MIAFGRTNEADIICDQDHIYDESEKRATIIGDQDHIYVAVDESEKRETIIEQNEAFGLHAYERCSKVEYPDEANEVHARGQFITPSDKAYGVQKNAQSLDVPHGVHEHEQIITYPNDAYGVNTSNPLTSSFLDKTCEVQKLCTHDQSLDEASGVLDDTDDYI